MEMIWTKANLNGYTLCLKKEKFTLLFFLLLLGQMFTDFDNI